MWSSGCSLIGSPLSFVFRNFLFLELPFVPLPMFVFLVFLEFASSSWYWSRRPLLHESVEPSRNASLSMSSQFAMSCCWSSSCAGFTGHVVPEGGAGSFPVPAMPARAASGPVVVRAESPDPFCFVALELLAVLRAVALYAAALAI